MANERTGIQPLDAGWGALSEGDWAGARGWFEEALGAGETPEALEGLGWAGYCLDDEALTFEARERAYRLYRGRGDGRSAARVAAWLAGACLEFRGEPAVANGWLQRAHGLLDDLQPGPDHGWLLIHEADTSPSP
jgi:LuxR family maltose regulon positive regulatory protein